MPSNFEISRMENIELMVTSLEELVIELKNELEVRIDSGRDDLALDVVPHTLQRGPFKGYTALTWPCGRYVHNDFDVSQDSIDEAYDFFGIDQESRIP